MQVLVTRGTGKKNNSEEIQIRNGSKGQLKEKPDTVLQSLVFHIGCKRRLYDIRKAIKSRRKKTKRKENERNNEKRDTKRTAQHSHRRSHGNQSGNLSLLNGMQETGVSHARRGGGGSGGEATERN